MVMYIDWFVNWRFNFAHSGIWSSNRFSLLLLKFRLISFFVSISVFCILLLGVVRFGYPVSSHQSYKFLYDFTHRYHFGYKNFVILLKKFPSFQIYNNNNQTPHVYKIELVLGYRFKSFGIWEWYVFIMSLNDIVGYISLLLRFCCSLFRLRFFFAHLLNHQWSWIRLRSVGWYQQGINIFFSDDILWNASNGKSDNPTIKLNDKLTNILSAPRTIIKSLKKAFESNRIVFIFFRLFETSEWRILWIQSKWWCDVTCTKFTLQPFV